MGVISELIRVEEILIGTTEILEALLEVLSLDGVEAILGIVSDVFSDVKMDSSEQTFDFISWKNGFP